MNFNLLESEVTEIMEAIILAGGLGTRLSFVTHDKIPKVMVDIGGVPFLKFILDYLTKQIIIKKVILSVGFKHEVIQEYFGSRYKGLDIEYVVEEKLLGTGGAVKRSLRRTKSLHVFVMNGDTLLDIDLERFCQFHNAENRDISIALKKIGIEGTSRYGNVKIKDGRIVAFLEKSSGALGFINCGVYIMRKDLFESFDMLEVFSFELDFLQNKVKNLQVGAFICGGYFVDIGVPKDYMKAQKDLGDASCG